MSLSSYQTYNDSDSKDVRAVSAPPSILSAHNRRGSRSMSVDPSGRYKGNHYDPNYHLKRQQPGGQKNGYRQQQVPQGYADRAGTSTLVQKIFGQNQNSSSGQDRSLSSSPSQREYTYSQPNSYNRSGGPGPDTYAQRGQVGSSTPTPSTANRAPPAGPASERGMQATQYSSASIQAPRPTSAVPERPKLAMDTTLTHPTRPGINANEPIWIKGQNKEKEDGEITASSSPASVKVHPSRLAQVPGSQTVSSTSAASLQAPPRPATTEPVPTRDQQIGRGPQVQGQGQTQMQRNTKPAPLTLTPIRDNQNQSQQPSGDGKTDGSTPTPRSASASVFPTSVFSPATKSPLDSLEKLRHFKEQVAASRKSVGSMSGQEMSKLAQVAETFLKSQNPEASADAFEQLKQLTGEADEIAGPSGPVAQAVPERQQTATPDSRQAELKEKLLALRGGKEGPQSSPRDKPSVSVHHSPAQTQAQVHGSTQLKRDRPPSDDGRPRQESDSKRARAQAWSDAREIDTRLHRIEADLAPPQQQAAPPARASEQYQRRRYSTSESSLRSSPPRASVQRGDYGSDRRLPPRRDSFADQRHASGSRYGQDTRDNRVRESRSRSPVARRQEHRPNGYDQRPPPTREQPHRPVDYGRPSRAVSSSDREYQTRPSLAYSPQPSSREPPVPRRQASPAPVEYARRPEHDRGRVPEPRYTREREDHYARVAPPIPVDTYQTPAPAPAPAPAPITVPFLTPALPQIDAATVHATLDILKAQIARLEALVPTMSPAAPIASPALNYDPYRVAVAPTAASVPPPQPAYRPDAQQPQPVYEARRAASPPSREYGYEARRPAASAPAPAPAPPAPSERRPLPRSPSPRPRRYNPSPAREREREPYQAVKAQQHGYQPKNGYHAQHGTTKDHDNNARYSYDATTKSYTQDRRREDQSQAFESRKPYQGYDNRANGNDHQATYTKTNHYGSKDHSNNSSNGGYSKSYQSGGYDNRAPSSSRGRGGGGPATRGGSTRGRGRGGAGRGGYDSRGDYGYYKT